MYMVNGPMRVSDIVSIKKTASESKRIIDKSAFQAELEAAERKIINEDPIRSYPHITNGYRIL